MDLQTALEKYFGFPHFRPGQEEALRWVLARRDTLVVMPTGAGKSLIYQLAALMLDGTTLVISPLVALMKDQVDSLTRRNIPATFINSTLETSEHERRLRNLVAGKYKIVLVAPERFRSRVFREALARVSLSLLAVDEAHCVSQWGHDFRPDYMHLVEARREFRVPLTLALTATATPRVQDDIIRILGLTKAERLVAGFNRPNLFFEVVSTPDAKAKLNFIREFLAREQGAGIIYTGTRRDAEEVSEFVREVCGRAARYYHGALDAATRTKVQDEFIAGDLPVVVATNAFGMGIDRPDVRFVLHYAMPGTVEAYYQEAGRAGRDDLPARAVMLFSPKDASLHEMFIENDSPTASELRAVHNYLQSTDHKTSDGIARATGLFDTKVKVALEQLELAQALRRGADESYGVLNVQVLPLAEDALRKISAQVVARRDHKYKLLDLMVRYAETNDCRRRTILNYFGDHGSADAPLCCDNCLARAEATDSSAYAEHPAQSQAEFVPLIVLDTIARLKWGLGKEKIAAILKGSQVKDIARYRGAQNYGKFANIKISEIESLIGELIDAGYIKQVGTNYPTLKLTPRGEEALRTRAAIHVNARAVQPGAAQRLQAKRDAGGTIAFTGQLLAQGKTVEQIAAERGLTVSTIYSHLAQLIAEGKVEVNAVVPRETQSKIRAAIERVGSVGYLTPIKALLPDAVDYNVIRCVANAWTREHTASVTAVVPDAMPTVGEDATLFARLRDWRTQQARALQLAAFLILSDATLHKIAPLKPRSSDELRAVSGIGPRKLEQFGDEIIALITSPISSLQSPSSDHPTSQTSTDPVADFLARPHPRELKGAWRAGWALDFHSGFDGAQHIRSVIGDLVFRFKYNGERTLARELATRWAQLLAAHSELPSADVIIPVPPSTPREFDPVTALAQELAILLKIAALTNVLVKTRATEPQKEMTSLAQKQANVAGAFSLHGEVRNKRVILVDDLFDSGATCHEAARVLGRGGAASIVVLTLTKTIHATE